MLVDEYDKVLLDNAFSPEVEELRRQLGGFYQVIKAKGALLRFVFMTGVTRYAMVNEFSGLNNLKHLSMSPVYGTNEPRGIPREGEGDVRRLPFLPWERDGVQPGVGRTVLHAWPREEV